MKFLCLTDGNLEEFGKHLKKVEIIVLILFDQLKYALIKSTFDLDFRI